MCLSPINIYNPSKYISLKHADAFTLSVACGSCAECQEVKHDEWYFRTNYECIDTFKNGGYVLFDTLTYRNEDLPHITDFYPDIPRHMDYPCFNRDHIRKFMVRLRRRLSYLGYPSIRYFLTSEYGVDPQFTHRPHYHVLFFVPKEIPPIELSNLIHESWQHGRTDGVYEYGANYVLSERVFTDMAAHGMQLANYVSKYVMKDSAFDANIRYRLGSITSYYYSLDRCMDDYGYELESRSFYNKLKNIVCQFHLQSKGFGMGYFDSPMYDLETIMQTGMIKMLVPKLSIYKHIPLPMYYFRHLFMDLVKVNGKRTWILHELGKKYRCMAKERNVENYAKHVGLLVQNIPSLNLSDNVYDRVTRLFDLDYKMFARYVLFERGRYKDGVLDYANVVDKYRVGLTTQNSFDFFHYGTNNDKFAYGYRFVTSKYLGSDLDGYDELADPIKRDKFKYEHCYFNPRLEKVYYTYLLLSSMLKSSKQIVFDKEQYLNQLYKIIFARV